MRRAVLALSLVLPAVGCSSVDAGTDPDRLVGPTWVLDAASLGSLVDVVPPDARVDIRFDGAQASGTSGCNSYGGAYEAADDGSLTFRSMMSTAMACESDRMALEDAYRVALADVSSFRVSGAGLILEGGAVALTYRDEEPMEALSLEGTTWSLTTIASGDAVASPLAGTEVTLTLMDGRASGSGGCNRFGATYTLDGPSLAFGPLAGTKMACETDVMEQESTVSIGLEATTMWSIEEDRLTLFDVDGLARLGYVGSPDA